MGPRLVPSALAFACLAVLSVLTLSGSPAFAQEPTSVDGLDVVQRSRYATIYALPGEGKRRAVISVQAQNYQRADGSWAPIVEELAAADQSSGMDFDCLENGLQSQFGRVNGLPMVRVNTIGNAPVSMVPAGMVARRADGSVIEQTAPNATVATRVGLRTVEYRNLYPGAIDQYIAVAERVKHSLVLDAAALQLPAGTAWIGGTYRFTLPAGYALQTASGDAISGSTVVERGLQIVDADGNAVYQILPVWVYDASGASIEGRYSVTVNDDATIDITMEADAAWATDPARVLPIEIDPTLTAQPDPAAGKDAYIRQAAPASNYGNDQHLGANYGVPNQWLICWVQYDVSPIPSDSTVDAARYEWYHWGNTATNETLSAHLVTAGWTETGVTWNNQPAYDNNNLTTLTYPAGQNAWRVWNTNLVSTTQGWVDGSIPNNGLMIRNDSQQQFFIYHYGSDYTANVALRPKYIVDYTENLGPMITSPAAGPLPDGYTTQAYSQACVVNGGQPNYTWTISAGALPAGVTINSSTGLISGTPTATGNFAFTVRVTDSNAEFDTRSFTMVVYAFPAITSPAAGALADGLINTPYGPINFTATGGKPSLIWSISAGSLPAGLSQNTSTGQINGTPSTVGNSAFTVRITDANGRFAERAYTIGVFDLPKITSPAAGPLTDGYVGLAYNATFTAAGGAPAYTWAVSAGSLPPGVSLGSGTGQLTGTPSTAGNYAFTIRVTDTNNDTDTRGYTVAVLNQPQITSPAAGALPPATRNAPNYTQTFTGANGKTPYSWSATGLPPGMTINPISGVVSGTPTGVATTYNVDVTLTDANGKTALVSYTLLLNGAMTITANSVSDGEEQVAYSQAISTSGGTTPFTFGLTIDPVLPDLTIDSSTGVISGTPSVGTGGNYDFYVTVTDSLGGTTNKAFSFYITLPTGGTAANCGCNSRATARDSAFAGWLWLLLPLLLLLARRRGD